MSQESEPVEEVEIEALAAKGISIPVAKRYIIRVDKQRVVVDQPKITGAEILQKVGFSPETHKLYQHRRGHQPALVAPTEAIDLRAPGVERFTTMPKDTTEGLGTAVRHQFRLPDADERYLRSLALDWEAVIENGIQWLLIHRWRTPRGYEQEEVSLALLVPPNYSDSQIDMVYFRPALSRSDKRSINALSDQMLDGERWQRWSRHRTAQHPWRPGVDDVASHLSLVDEWLRREFEPA